MEGQGIGLKSICDIKDDLAEGRVVTLLDHFRPDFSSVEREHSSDLYAVYPTKKYLPLRVQSFIDLLYKRLNE